MTFSAQRLATRVLAILLGLFWFACASSAQRLEASVRPGINDHSLGEGMEVDRWVQSLEVESRKSSHFATSLREGVGVQPGMSIADVGAGTGLFVPLLARAVGAPGQVYAVDIIPDFVAHVRDRASEDDLEQVTAC